MRLFFALQQTLVGALRLNLPIAEDAPLSSGLTLLYLLFAQTFWPVYARTHGAAVVDGHIVYSTEA